jgi:hypothetical protein
MITIIFTEEDISAWRSWRFQHPNPRGQGRMEALYVRSQGVAQAEILRLCGSSNARFPRHRKAYMAGGITQLKRLDHSRPPSALANHRTTREADLHQPPPATVAEAAAKLAELTGIVRKPTQVRQSWRARGMKPMTVGMRPAKADVEAQDACKKKPGAQGTGR